MSYQVEHIPKHWVFTRLSLREYFGATEKHKGVELEDVPLSVVIRALNEARNLAILLPQIRDQRTKAPIEIIVVDNESTDNTRALAKQYGAKVVHLPKKDFSYPLALNLGLAQAKSELVVLLSAHSFLPSNDWMSSIAGYFAEREVVGVYGLALPSSDASLLERTLRLLFTRVRSKRVPRRVISDRRGLFGATNAVIRRSVWQEYPFDEKYGAGGEDTNWAKQQMARGKVFVRAPVLSVCHSHRTGSLGYLRQMRHWRRVAEDQRKSFLDDAWNKKRWD